MNTSEERSLKSGLMAAIGWVGVSVMIYLFCLGPTCRWFPDAAEFIYVPLSPVADWPVFGPAMRRWVSVWGVDVGEKDRELDMKQ